MLLFQDILPDMALIHIYLVHVQDAGSLDPRINVLPLGQFGNLPIVIFIAI